MGKRFEKFVEERCSRELSFPVGDPRAQHVMLFPDQYRESAP